MKEIEVDLRGLVFCRVMTVALLAAALLTRSVYLVAAVFVLMAVPAFLSVRFSPFLLFYETVMARLLGRRPKIVEVAPLRFAQGMGASLLLIALFLSSVLHRPLAGWILTGTVALTTTSGAAGFCVGEHIYRFGRRLANSFKGR